MEKKQKRLILSTDFNTHVLQKRALNFALFIRFYRVVKNVNQTINIFNTLFMKNKTFKFIYQNIQKKFD